MKHLKPLEQVAEDGHYKYYAVMVQGYSLMYRQNKYRPDGRRQYKISNELARLVGFWKVEDLMRYVDTRPIAKCKKHIQFWRGFISPEALQRHFDYDNMEKYSI